MKRKNDSNEPHFYIQLNIILEEEFYANLGDSDLYDPAKIDTTK